LQRHGQRLVLPGRVGHEQQFAVGLPDGVGQDRGGGADWDMMGPRAAPYGLDGHLARTLRVSGCWVGQVGQADGAVDAGERVEQGGERTAEVIRGGGLLY
jgi:hypothetical protein